MGYPRARQPDTSATNENTDSTNGRAVGDRIEYHLVSTDGKGVYGWVAADRVDGGDGVILGRV